MRFPQYGNLACVDWDELLQPPFKTLALATHTKKIKSFDGKRGGSHEMLISDVCHNYQF